MKTSTHIDTRIREDIARQKAALDRLIQVAYADTGQSRRVADFLLAWWNAEECGGFDLTDLWSVDSALAEDMLEITRLIATSHSYPDALGYGPQLEKVFKLWRSSQPSGPALTVEQK